METVRGDKCVYLDLYICLMYAYMAPHKYERFLSFIYWLKKGEKKPLEQTIALK
jgi:hypothetical protein